MGLSITEKKTGRDEGGWTMDGFEDIFYPSVSGNFRQNKALP